MSTFQRAVINSTMEQLQFYLTHILFMDAETYPEIKDIFQDTICLLRNGYVIEHHHTLEECIEISELTVSWMKGLAGIICNNDAQCND